MKSILVFLLLVLNPTSKERIVSVQTPQTEISGRRIPISDGHVDVFLGVPFAQAPVGSLRYKKPKPIVDPPSKLDAFQYSPSCMQIRQPVEDYITDSQGIFKVNKQSEDCLFLNIWVPATNGSNEKKKDVMFWIHGGGLLYGSTDYEVYNGEMLAYDGDVIVVTTNYRLGSFGFLAINKGEESGNLGLYDQAMALTWVRDNIQYFGGDPSSITIFGQSAGGMSVTAHITSKISDGLFKKAIIQSGMPIQPLFGTSFKEAFSITAEFSTIVRCAPGNSSTVNDESATILDCLRKKSASELAHGDYLLLKAKHKSNQFYFNYEEEFFEYKSVYPFHPSFINKDITIMMGLVKDEAAGIFFCFFPEIFRDAPKKYTYKKTYAMVLKFFESHFQAYNWRSLIDIYFGHIPKDNTTAVNIALNDLLTDFLFSCPSIIVADYFVAQGIPVYFYYFNHPSQNVHFQLLYDTWPGAFHLDELQYVFGFPKINSSYSYTPEERLLSTHMLQTWASFAKTGIPTLRNQSWPLYTGQNAIFLNTHPAVFGPVPRKDICFDVIQNIFQGIEYDLEEFQQR